MSKYKMQKENNNKKVTKKWKKNIIIMTLVGTVLVGVANNINKKDNIGSTTAVTTTENVTMYIDAGEDEPVKNNGNKENISISNSDYKEFLDYLENVEEVYEYSDYYQIDESLEKYEKLTKKVIFKDDIRDVNGKITTEKLYPIVLKNNKDYLSKGDNVVNCFYEEMSDSDVLDICNLVVEIINKTIEEESNIDIDKISSNLCKLKIVKTKSSAGNMAQTTSDFVLKISPSMMELYQSIHEEKDTSYDVITHEVMHLLQSGYLELKEDNVTEVSGPCVMFKDQVVNPLYLSFMQEALAEIAMEKVTGHDATMYPNQRSYINTLILCNILNDETNVDDLLKATFNNDINDLYNFFGAKSYDEKKNISSMLYNIQIIEQRDPSEFIELYKKIYNIDLSQDKEKLNSIKQKLRCEAYVTLSKIFYKNLAYKINVGGVTLQDTLYLIRVFESDMHTHLLYTEMDRFVDTTDFIEIYKGIQENFFSAISNKEIDEMYEKLNNYSMLYIDSDEIVKNNFDLNFIGSDKKKFIMKLQGNVYKTGIPNIIDVNESSFSK